MGACSLIAERSLFYSKNSASEGNGSLLADCRVQPVLFKNSASERNESLLTDCRVHPVFCWNIILIRNTYHL